MTIREWNSMMKTDMKSRFFLLSACLMILCALSSPLFALEHDGGDKIILPENTDFGRKFNKFMEPISFGVGSEPGFEKNAVYIYFMYRYAEKYSWMIKFDMESSVSGDRDIDFRKPGQKGMKLEVDKKKMYSLSLLPVVRHFEYMDLGFGLVGEYNRYVVDDLDCDSRGNTYLELNRDVFMVGPLIYMHWQYPLSDKVDIGGTTELAPVLWAFLNDKYHVAYYYHEDNIEGSYRDKDKDYGIGVPAVSQEIYFTFFKFLNISAGLEYEFFRLGSNDDMQVSHDATLRFGLALLKKPKSGFLNYLIGVFYERDWSFMDVGAEHIYDHEGRWIFCVGTSG